MPLLSTVGAPVDMEDVVRARLSQAMQRSYVAAYRILGNADQARDACQEAAARALSARDRYDHDRPFYPWFYRILKNHCLDHLKRRRRTIPVGDGPPRVDEAPTAEGQAVQDERARALSRAVEGLPMDLREIIELRHFQDLSYEEMAEVLACPVGTVMSRLYRARKQLRQALLSDAAFSQGFSTAPGGDR